MRGRKTIYTTKATSRIIDGSYNSIYKGRSMNFDDLREYVVGDEIRDVDWKASARSQKLLVRQYIAEKKHNLMLVMDADRRMLANANEESEKYEVALMAAGTLAYMVSGNGDYVGASYVTEGGVRHFPFKTGLMNVESILAKYHSDVTVDNRRRLDEALDFLLKNYRRRMIVLIITDMKGILELSESMVRQLKVMHDVLVVGVADAGSYGKGVYNMDDDRYLPDFFTDDKKLERLEKAERQALEKRCDERLKKMGVSGIVVDSEENMDEKLTLLLEKHRLASGNAK